MRERPEDFRVCRRQGDEGQALGWYIATIGTVIAGMFGLGGFGSIPDGAGTLFCGALALLFVAALLVIAGRDGSRP